MESTVLYCTVEERDPNYVLVLSRVLKLFKYYFTPDSEAIPPPHLEEILLLYCAVLYCTVLYPTISAQGAKRPGLSCPVLRLFEFVIQYCIGKSRCIGKDARSIIVHGADLRQNTRAVWRPALDHAGVKTGKHWRAGQGAFP